MDADTSLEMQKWDLGCRSGMEDLGYRIGIADGKWRIKDADAGRGMQDRGFRMQAGGFRMQMQVSRHRTRNTDAGHRRGAAGSGIWMQMEMDAGHRAWDGRAGAGFGMQKQNLGGRGGMQDGRRGKGFKKQ